MYNWRRGFQCRKITYGEAIQNLLTSCKSFGSSKQGRRVLIKENWGDNRIKKFYSEMWETPFEMGLVKIPRDSSCMMVL